MKISWKVYVLTLISFIVGTSQFIIVGLLDKIAMDLGISVATAGQLITVFALANAFGTPLIIMLTAKLDKRKQLILALSIILLGVLIIAMSKGFNSILFARIILGIGTGVFTVSAYGTAAKLASPEFRGRAMSNVAMGVSASLILGVPIGRMLSVFYNWKMIFGILGILCFIAIIVLIKVIPSSEVDKPIPLGEQLSYLKKPTILLTLLITFLVFIGYSLINTYITPFTKVALLINENQISPILLTLGIASLIGAKTGGKLADRFGARKTLMASMLVQISSLLILSLIAGIRVPTLIFLIIYEMSAWTFGPTQNYNLVTLAPEAYGIMLSLNSSFVQMGFATGAGIGGLAISSFSVLSITIVGAISVLIALIIRLKLQDSYIKVAQSI